MRVVRRKNYRVIFVSREEFGNGGVKRRGRNRTRKLRAEIFFSQLVKAVDLALVSGDVRWTEKRGSWSSTDFFCNNQDNR